MSVDAVAWLEKQPTTYPWGQRNPMDIIQTELFSLKRDHETVAGDDGWCPICVGTELIVLDHLDVPTPTL